MDSRKKTDSKGVKLPQDYLDLVTEVFTKNFAKKLLIEKGKKERFCVYGQIYSEEILLIVSLENPTSLRMMTCYASVDYPPKKLSSEKKAASPADAVQAAVNLCVDGIASFFQTYFEEGRPVDYDLEYRQNWTSVELEKGKTVFLKINRDNLDLEAQADALLELDDQQKQKKKLH